MASLPSPSSPSRAMRRRGCVRRVERYCCNFVTYFPLAFVYGVTSWAVWVEAGMGFDPTAQGWTGKTSSFLAILFYVLLNWSYTTAVFTDPGSPLSTAKNGYSHLPTQESAMTYTSFTVKSSTGDIRFCKKCQAKKPDRAHHCSTCGRCVLKMDHHCPWLATCVGLRNYKAFLLFLSYLSLFCWVCFATTATWVWNQLLRESQYSESFMPVNYVLLAVLSGIIGLVITGFTSWHLWLTSRGRTTIESLEKTRYLSPLRNTMKHQLNNRNYLDARDHGRLSVTEQLREIHANALPGITRPEEGEDSPSRSASHSPDPRHQSVGSGYSPAFPSYGHYQRQRDYDRYDSYLDERDNELLPNAFDLGLRRNFGHVFGPSLFLAFFPVCNTTGDGWTWEASPKWLAALDRVTKEREVEANLQKQRERAAGWGLDSPTELEFMQSGRAPGGSRPGHSPPTSAPRQTRRPEWQSPGRKGGENRYLTTTNGVVATPLEGRRSPGKADQILGRERGMYSDGDVQLQSLDRRKLDQYYVSEDDEYESSSDEEGREQRASQSSKSPHQRATENWNDVPEDFLQPAPRRTARRSAEQGKGRSRSKQDGWDEWGGDP